MANEKLIDPHEFWDRLNKASYDVITYPDREMDSPQFGYYTDTIQAVLNQTKKVDAEIVVHGRWIPTYTVNWWMGTQEIDGFTCNQCARHFKSKLKLNYCPNCGAKMDGERKDNA